MSKITSAILAKIAPQTKAELRDRFIPYLNEALPRYGIISELQVAGFLATAAFESQYFQKTKEGRARSSSPIWIKYQSKYWHTNFMGRGIFQTTHEKNYRTFGQKMKKKGLVEDSEMFVKNPELLEQPKWAVESACEYWETNGLDKYAIRGFKGFSALQGRVNKGSADKVAHDYPNRLIVYERTRLAIADDFKLDSVASNVSLDTTPVEDTESTNTPEPSVEATTPPTITIPAPSKDGATATSTKLVIAGITVPTFLVPIITAIKELASEGYVDVKEIINWMLTFVRENQKYVFMLIGLLIVLLIVKKIVKQVTFWITMITHALPNLNAIEVQPTEPEQKKWWQI